MAGNLGENPQMLARIFFRADQKEKCMDRFIYTLWTNKMFIDINQGFTDLTGYTYEDVIGKISPDLSFPLPFKDYLALFSEEFF